MSAEESDPKPPAVDTESAAERESAYADFRSGLAERLVAEHDRTHTYLNVRLLGEQLKDGGLAYIEAEISEEDQSGDAVLNRISVMVPDSETGNYRDGKTIYEADLPFGEVRVIEQHDNLSDSEARRAEEKSKKARHMMVATRSTIQAARAKILADRAEGFEGRMATAHEVRSVLERLGVQGQSEESS